MNVVKDIASAGPVRSAGLPACLESHEKHLLRRMQRLGEESGPPGWWQWLHSALLLGPGGAGAGAQRAFAAVKLVDAMLLTDKQTTSMTS